MKTRLLLLALLVAPLLTAQEIPCPTVYPPDACDTSVVGVSPVPDPPLSQGTVACWNLDEAVGLTRVDDCGSNDLDDNGTSDVNVIAGQNNNGIQQVVVNACLQGGSVVAMGNEWTVNIWVDSLGDNSAAIANGQFSLTGSVSVTFGINNVFAIAGGGTGTECIATEQISGFHMFTAWLHPSDGKIHCALDNGPETIAAFPVTMPTISGTLQVGGTNSCSFSFGPAGVDEVSFWDRALSEASREALLTTFAPY